MKGSGMLACIPQKGTCPNMCEDCFFQSGRSFLEPLHENTPNMPPLRITKDRVIRINDGNDSNIDSLSVIRKTLKYEMKFYNTSIPDNLEKFPAPVVLTINPGKMTDIDYYVLAPIPKNLMFVRIRAKLWNISKVIRPAITYYTEKEVPVVLTFMAYYDSADKIPLVFQASYSLKKRTLNEYYCIDTQPWEEIMSLFRHNKWVYSCSKIEGELGTHACHRCGNCLREYFYTMEKLRSD